MLSIWLDSPYFQLLCFSLRGGAFIAGYQTDQSEKKKKSDLNAWQFNCSASSTTANSIRQMNFLWFFSLKNCPNEAGNGVTRLWIGTLRAKQQNHRKFPSIMWLCSDAALPVLCLMQFCCCYHSWLSDVVDVTMNGRLWQTLRGRLTPIQLDL